MDEFMLFTANQVGGRMVLFGVAMFYAALGFFPDKIRQPRILQWAFMLLAFALLMPVLVLAMQLLLPQGELVAILSIPLALAPAAFVSSMVMLLLSMTPGMTPQDSQGASAGRAGLPTTIETPVVEVAEAPKPTE